jgi:hypothetical protein
VALGVVSTGQKHPLGLSDGSTENATECDETLTLSDRLRRSLATTNSIESLMSRTSYVRRDVKRCAMLQDGDRRIVGLEIRGGGHLAGEFVANGHERGGDVGHPATDRGARQVHALTQEDPFEPVQREMIDVLRHHAVGEQAFRGEGLLKGLGQRRRFDQPRRGSAGRRT